MISRALLLPAIGVLLAAQALLPLTSRAQVCVSGAEPVEIEGEEDVNAGQGLLPEFVKVKVTQNYKGVLGVTLTVREGANGASRSVSIPSWLMALYGGNAGAIESDLEAGVLANRGPCS